MHLASVRGLVVVLAGLALLMATYVAAAMLVYAPGSCLYADLPPDIGTVVNEASPRQEPIVFPVGVSCTWQVASGELNVIDYSPSSTVFVCLAAAIVVIGLYVDVRANRRTKVDEVVGKP